MPAPIEIIKEKRELTLSDATTIDTSDVDLEAGGLKQKWINLTKFKKEEAFSENTDTSLDKCNEKSNHYQTDTAIEPDLPSVTTASHPSALAVARTALTAVVVRLVSSATKRRRCGLVLTREFTWGLCFGIRHGESIYHPFTWIVLPLTYLVPFGIVMFLMFGLPILLDKRSPEEKKADAQEWGGVF